MEDLDNLVPVPDETEPEETETGAAVPDEVEPDGEVVEEDSGEVVEEPGTESVGDTINYDMYYTAVYNAVNDAIVANQEVTDYQSIPDVVLKHFEGILTNKMLPVDYVVYVGSPYQYQWGNNTNTGYDYCMAYGDLYCSGEYFSGTGTIVTMRTNGYNTITYQNDQQISLVAPRYYSKSNLGDYPGIYHYDYVSLAILLGMVLGGVTWLFKKLLCIKY